MNSLLLMMFKLQKLLQGSL